MNANELADELVDLIVAPTPVDDKWACELIDKAATMLRQLEADNDELKAYNTELHGIEHDLEMKVSKLQKEIAELKNSRDYWCLQYKDVMGKLDHMAGELMSLENSIRFEAGYGHN